MSSSAKKEKPGNNTDLALEEAWLLWKLGKLREAREVVYPMLDSGAVSRDYLELGALLSLNEGDLSRAKAIIEKLERVSPSGKTTRELKGEYYSKKGNWEKAGAEYEALIAGYPDNMDYRTTMIYVSEKLLDFRRARKEYESAFEKGYKKKNLVWEYRDTLEKASSGPMMSFEYLQGPEGMWHCRNAQGVFVDISKGLTATYEFLQETYRQKALGTVPAIKQSMIGNRVTALWSPVRHFSVRGIWKASYYAEKDNNELGVEIDTFPAENFHLSVGYIYSDLIDSPLDGLVKQAVEDILRCSESVYFFDRLRIGHELKTQWLRLPSGQNQVNGSDYLGYIITSDQYADLMVIPEPYISGYIRYRRAYWSRPFTEANEVLGFFTDERAYSSGFMVEHKIGNFLKPSFEMARTYDSKRDIFSTYSRFLVDVWPAAGAKLTFSYEFFYGDSGTNGAGNSQVASMKMRVNF